MRDNIKMLNYIAIIIVRIITAMTAFDGENFIDYQPGELFNTEYFYVKKY